MKKLLPFILCAFIFSLNTEQVLSQKVKRTTIKTKNGTVKRTTVKRKNRTVTRTKVKNKNNKTVAVRTKVKRNPSLRYKNLPKRGAVITKRPRRAKVIRFNNRKYWLSNGVYYTKFGKGYQVVRPRRGIRIRTLPIGYSRITVRNRPYFYYYGSYYQQVDEKEEYEVVNAPIEAQVNGLPDGYETVIEDGQTLYKVDEVYYKEVPLDEDGINWGYEVVRVDEITE